MAVDQRLVDPDRPRDLFDRRVLHSALVEQRPRGRDDVALALLARGARGAAAEACGSHGTRGYHRGRHLLN